MSFGFNWNYVCFSKSFNKEKHADLSSARLIVENVFILNQQEMLNWTRNLGPGLEIGPEEGHC
jgi:hypothetical protein